MLTYSWNAFYKLYKSIEILRDKETPGYLVVDVFFPRGFDYSINARKDRWVGSSICSKKS
jgi:hypothetical protein